MNDTISSLDDDVSLGVVMLNTTTIVVTADNNSATEVELLRIFGGIVGCIGMLLLLCASNRRNRAPPETWRGEEMRLRAMGLWQDPEPEFTESEKQHRTALFAMNFRTKRVVSKDPQTGHWTLGSIVTEVEKPLTRCPTLTDSPSRGVNEFPFGANTEEEQDDRSTIDAEVASSDDEDDEHVCVICLEPFKRGELVSWSRYSRECHHVYHSDCIQPWVQEKRHDDCPSCRSKLILVTKEEDVKEEINQRHQEAEDDSLFLIVHGLIQNLAHQASQIFLCGSSICATNSVSMTEEDSDSKEDEASAFDDISSEVLSFPSPSLEIPTDPNDGEQQAVSCTTTISSPMPCPIALTRDDDILQFRSSLPRKNLFGADKLSPIVRIHSDVDEEEGGSEWIMMPKTEDSQYKIDTQQLQDSEV